MVSKIGAFKAYNVIKTTVADICSLSKCTLRRVFFYSKLSIISIVRLYCNKSLNAEN